jgi:DNA repair protein RadC
MPIRDWPESERPRERLLRHGAAALSDAELLAIYLRVGIRGRSAVDLARDLLVRFDGHLAALASASTERLADTPGIGPAKAAQLAASFELARRALDEEMRSRDTLSSPRAVRDWLRLRLAGEGREVFVALWLDSQNRLIASEELFRGTLAQTSVYPREVVKSALAHNAAAVILAHNHPSGVAEPSSADEQLTTALKQALTLIDVRVLDHFIVAGTTQPLSFAERGLL